MSIFTLAELMFAIILEPFTARTVLFTDTFTESLPTDSWVEM